MRVRMPDVAWIGSWVLGLGCGPGVETGDQPSSGGGSTTTGTTTVMGTTALPEDTTPMTTIEATSLPTSTTEALDDGPWLDLPPDLGDGDCITWATRGCGIPGARGVVTGTTAVGEFETTYAVFGGLVGCPVECAMLPPNVWRIALAADPDLLESIPPNGMVEETLVIDLDIFDPTETQPVGVPLSASLRATRGGASLQTYMAEVVLDLLPTVEQVSEPFDPRTAAVVTGSVTAEAPGWSVTGTFAASYCPQSNSIFSCE